MSIIAVPGFKAKIIQLVAITGLFWVVSLPIHEYSHLAAGKLAGGALHIVGTTWGAFAKCQWITYPAYGQWFVFLAGGLGVFLAMLVIWGVARWTPTTWDISSEFAAAFMGCSQLGYGIAEITLSRPAEWGTFPVLSVVLVVVASLVVAGLYAKPLAKWLKGGE